MIEGLLTPLRQRLFYGDLKMIIATIGHYKYKLKDITAAEQLLKIINDSVPVADHFIKGNGTVFSISNYSTEMSLSIFQGDLISDEYLEKLRDEELQKG